MLSLLKCQDPGKTLPEVELHYIEYLKLKHSNASHSIDSLNSFFMRIGNSEFLEEWYYLTLNITNSSHFLLDSLGKKGNCIIDLIKVNESFHNLRFEEASSMMSTLVDNCRDLPAPIQFELLLKRLHILQYGYRPDVVRELVHQKLSIKWFESPLLNKYAMIQLLRFQGYEEREGVAIFKSFSSLNYAYHIYKKEKLGEFFPNLEGHILFSLGASAIREYYFKTAIAYLENSLRFLSLDSDFKVNVFSQLALSHFLEGDSIKYLNYIDSCKLITIDDLSPLTQYYINTNIGWIYSLMKDENESQRHLLNAFQITRTYNKCSFLNNSVTGYLIDLYMTTDNHKEATRYFDILRSDCRPSYDDDIQILNNGTEARYLFYSYDKEQAKDLQKLENVIKLLESQLLKIDEKLINNDFHYADLVHENISLRLRAYLELYSITNDEQYKRSFFELSQLGKNRSISLGMNDFSIRGRSNNEIREKLRLINDFENVVDPTDQVYNDLYHLYHNQTEVASAVNLLSVFPYKNVSKIIDHSTTIIDTYQDGSTLWIYSTDGNQDSLFAIENEENILERFLEIDTQSDSSIIYFENLSNFLISIIDNCPVVDKKNVIVIGDGLLASIPWGIVSHFDTSYTDIEFSYSYSWELIAGYEKDPEKLESVSLLGFSNKNTLISSKVSKVNELPNNILEINNISELFEGQKKGVYTGEEMKSQKILAAKDNDVIHIASHAVSDMDNRLNNFIITRDKTGIDQLYGYELLEKEFKSDLVFLSGCETGRGIELSGSGVFSLSKDFIQSGASTVIKTLWKIDDKAIAHISTYFYENLLQGNDVSRSLKFAKEKYKASVESKLQHPYYWAGIVIEGNPYLNFKL